MTSQSQVWLEELVTHEQRSALLRLLASTPFSRQERASHMLLAPPMPSDETDAGARVAAVMTYLTMEKPQYEQRP